MSLRTQTLGFLSAALLTLGAPAAASAATTTATANVNGGALSLTTSAAPSFGVTLDGTDQTGTYTVPSTVTDARGTSAGWNLTLTSTQFSTGGSTPSTLSTGASSLTGVTNACVSGSTCTAPTNAITYPVAVPAGTTAPAAVKYFNAAASTGKGKFTNTPSVNVSVPANSDAGTYTSTLTLAAVSGP